MNAVDVCACLSVYKLVQETNDVVHDARRINSPLSLGEYSMFYFVNK